MTDILTDEQIEKAWKGVDGYAHGHLYNHALAANAELQEKTAERNEALKQLREARAEVERLNNTLDTDGLNNTLDTDGLSGIPENRNLEKANAHLEAEVIETAAERDQAIQAIGDTAREVERLKAELAEARAERQVADNRYSTVKVNKERDWVRMDAKVREVERLESERDEARAEVRRLSNTEHDLISSLRKAEAEVEAAEGVGQAAFDNYLRLATAAREEGRKDYEGMRDMQAKFIAADQELRALRTAAERVVEAFDEGDGLLKVVDALAKALEGEAFTPPVHGHGLKEGESDTFADANMTGGVMLPNQNDDEMIRPDTPPVATPEQIAANDAYLETLTRRPFSPAAQEEPASERQTTLIQKQVIPVGNYTGTTLAILDAAAHMNDPQPAAPVDLVALRDCLRDLRDSADKASPRSLLDNASVALLERADSLLAAAPEGQEDER